MLPFSKKSGGARCFIDKNCLHENAGQTRGTLRRRPLFWNLFSRENIFRSLGRTHPYLVEFGPPVTGGVSYALRFTGPTDTPGLNMKGGTPKFPLAGANSASCPRRSAVGSAPRDILAKQNTSIGQESMRMKRETVVLCQQDAIAARKPGLSHEDQFLSRFPSREGKWGPGDALRSFYGHPWPKQTMFSPLLVFLPQTPPKCTTRFAPSLRRLEPMQ